MRHRRLHTNYYCLSHLYESLEKPRGIYKDRKQSSGGLELQEEVLLTGKEHGDFRGMRMFYTSIVVMGPRMYTFVRLIKMYI